MHTVFLSYSRRDLAWVDELEQELNALEARCWVDRREIQVSLPWMGEVGDAIIASTLFVTCRSPASTASRACALEKAIAQEHAIATSRVTVGEAAPLAAMEVLNELRGLHPDRWIRTELRVRARDWDRSERPRSMLLSRRPTDRLIGAGSGARKQIEIDFLRACRRRQERLRRGRRIAAAALVMALLIPGIVAALRDGSRQASTNQVAADSISNSTAAAALDDPFRGLVEAAQRGRSESAEDALVIAAGIADPTPQDAFITPPQGHFAAHPVTSDVVLRFPDGSTWGRAADASDTRQATPRPPDSPTPVVSGAHPVAPRSSGEIEVTGPEGVHRRLFASGPTTAAALSPDRRVVAAAVGKTIDLIDVETGRRRQRLRGSPHPIEDVAWNEDSGVVWAVANNLAISWSVRHGRVLVNDPTSNFIAIVASADAHSDWIVAAKGPSLNNVSG